MTEKTVKFPERRAIKEEARAWLIKLDGDQAPSAKELAALREWLARSAVHREVLARYAETWGKMNALTELAVPLEKPTITTRGGIFRRSDGSQFSGWRLAVTTTSIFIAVAVSASLWLRTDSFEDGNGLYATAVGQQESVVLPDGSVVLLNTDTQLKVAYADIVRDIRLMQGEAHFTVAKDATKPFRVFAGNDRVQAIGTAFSVHLKNASVDITVTEGRVALASLEKVPFIDRAWVSGEAANVRSNFVELTEDGYVETIAELNAGERASIASAASAGAEGVNRHSGRVEALSPDKLAKRTSWREGFLTFTGDPLEEVIDEISRYTTMSIDIADPTIGAIEIGGRFPVGETQAMFEALQTNFALEVTYLGHDHVVLSVAND